MRLEQEGIDAGDLDSLARRGMALMIEQIEETLRRYNVVYDTWSSERALHESGSVERALVRAAGGRPHLRERGRHLAADHRVRRRQGPGPDPLGR